MDFIVDKQTKMVSIHCFGTHVQNGNFLTSGGPKTFGIKNKVMDFRVVGRRFYAMVSPDGRALGRSEIYLHYAKNQFQAL